VGYGRERVEYRLSEGKIWELYEKIEHYLPISVWYNGARKLSCPMANPPMNRPANIIPRFIAAVWRTPPRMNQRAPIKTTKEENIPINFRLFPGGARDQAKVTITTHWQSFG
jgi:hypothetical protein